MQKDVEVQETAVTASDPLRVANEDHVSPFHLNVWLLESPKPTAMQKDGDVQDTADWSDTTSVPPNREVNGDQARADPVGESVWIGATGGVVVAWLTSASAVPIGTLSSPTTVTQATRNGPTGECDRWLPTLETMRATAVNLA